MVSGCISAVQRRPWRCFSVQSQIERLGLRTTIRGQLGFVDLVQAKARRLAAAEDEARDGCRQNSTIASGQVAHGRIEKR